MRFREILSERRRQKKMIYYHGTIGEFVPSILKHGLIPNPKYRNYNDGEYKTFEGGVYLALDENATIGHINNLKNNTELKNSDGIIITVQVTEKSYTMDEDEIMTIISNIIYDISTHLYNNYEDDDVDVVEYINSLIPKYTEIQMTNINMNNEYIRKAYIEIIEYMLSSIIFDISDEDDFNNLGRLLGAIDSTFLVGHFRDEPEFEELMNKIFKYSSGKTKTPATIRVERPIKFSGKTKIIRIENLTTGKVLYEHT